MYYNKKKFALSILWIIAGAVLLLAELGGFTHNPIFSGLGGAWIAVGILQIVRNVKYHTDDAYKEKVNLGASDERNCFLRMKAWSWAGYLFVFGAAIVSLGLFAAGFTQHGQVVCVCMCAMLALYWVAYLVFQKKY